MKKYLIAFLAIFLVSASTKSQSYADKIPDGYSLAQGWGDKGLMVEADFNQDEKLDYFMILRNEAQDIFLYSLISSGNKLEQNALVPIRNDGFYCCSAIELKAKNVVQIHSLGNRYFQQYKIRWDSWQQQFRIIGFDDEDLPSHTGNSYSHSFNFYTRQLISIDGHNDFATGEYIAKEKKRNVKDVGKFYLIDFDKCTVLMEKIISPK